MQEIGTILDEIRSVLTREEVPDQEEIAKALMDKRIFVIGEGRSGLMGKSFAMRLMHLGATVYVVGETITPSIAEGDVLFAVSGSGTTKNVTMVAEKAKQIGCTVIGVTTDPASELGRLSNLIVTIPAATKYRRENESASIQPLGSLFDQCAHIVFDSICLIYSKLQSQDHGSAYQRHSNLE
jgi:6-phospho-3-hexuloisomerase